MNNSLVSKQNQDVWLAENPDEPQNYLLSIKELLMLECHRNSVEASYCIYRAYMISNIIKKSGFFTFHYFMYDDLQGRYIEIANMYVNVFGIKYSETEIEKKWKELLNYAEENYLQYFYIDSTQKYFKFEMEKFINQK